MRTHAERLALNVLGRFPWPVVLAVGAVVLTVYDVARMMADGILGVES